MEYTVLSRETPLEFFRGQLLKAMEHQRVSTSAFIEWYLVNLLAACVRGDVLPREEGYDETPLALLYVRAVQASRAERARLLQVLGDTALFATGFFAESLHGRLVSLDYYRALGGRAYARLGEEAADAVAPSVFRELGERFMEFADLLQEVSEASRLATPQATVKLYERWLETGSRRAAALLAQEGIFPQLPVEGPLQ
jgi:hypothetical protein